MYRVRAVCVRVERLVCIEREGVRRVGPAVAVVVCVGVVTRAVLVRVRPLGLRVESRLGIYTVVITAA